MRAWHVPARRLCCGFWRMLLPLQLVEAGFACSNSTGSSLQLREAAVAAALCCVSDLSGRFCATSSFTIYHTPAIMQAAAYRAVYLDTFPSS